jgi:hypothetical protein
MNSPRGCRSIIHAEAETDNAKVRLLRAPLDRVGVLPQADFISVGIEERGEHSSGFNVSFSRRHVLLLKLAKRRSYVCDFDTKPGIAAAPQFRCICGGDNLEQHAIEMEARHKVARGNFHA